MQAVEETPASGKSTKTALVNNRIQGTRHSVGKRADEAELLSATSTEREMTSLPSNEQAAAESVLFTCKDTSVDSLWRNIISRSRAIVNPLNS